MVQTGTRDEPDSTGSSLKGRMKIEPVLLRDRKEQVTREELRVVVDTFN
jgi:hypothetical protein